MLVSPDQIDATLDALFALGYSEHFLAPRMAESGTWS